MTTFENVGVFIREKVWLENSLSLLAQAIHSRMYERPLAKVRNERKVLSSKVLFFPPLCEN
jgi:hypothetical protein